MKGAVNKQKSESKLGKVVYIFSKFADHESTNSLDLFVSIDPPSKFSHVFHSHGGHGTELDQTLPHVWQ